MYKVFFNDKKIVIVAPGKITINKTLEIIDDIQTKDTIKNWFFEFSKSNIQEVVLINKEPKRFFEEIFRPAFREIKAAGGVVKRDNTFLFIFRNEKWDLPKGKIDDGETNEEAAIREVAEECGISGHKIEKQLPSTFHIYKSPYKESKGELIFKETFWFEMKYEGKENGQPQISENISEIRWFKKEDLETVFSNTYANLYTLIELYRD
ncbi:MAG: NUDIX domain-containing protein [Bacteroidetes bacterium]|nr:NUDIX domain-containing protein [Bacteroidota bacterium]